MRINDVPASTGYGEPVQKLFKFDDGERMVGALSLDPRLRRRPRRQLAAGGHASAASACASASTRTASCRPARGRRFAKAGEGDEIVGVRAVGDDSDVVVRRHRATHALVCKADEVTELAGPGRGVMVIKVDDDDGVVGVRRRRAEGQGRRCIASRPTSGKKLRCRPGRATRSPRAAARATSCSKRKTKIERASPLLERSRRCPNRRAPKD